jgi:pyruvoyl-dependent arginine decarboxylase (PvlArgDC)
MINIATISSITPEKAQKILRENGLQCSLQEAAGILEFLIKLAQTSICHEENSIPIHQGKHRRAS